MPIRIADVKFAIVKISVLVAKIANAMKGVIAAKRMMIRHVVAMKIMSPKRVLTNPGQNVRVPINKTVHANVRPRKAKLRNIFYGFHKYRVL